MSVASAVLADSAPNRPPQHLSAPLDITAQELPWPFAITVAPELITLIGARTVAGVATPTWPDEFEPQQETAPLPESAHACE